MWAKHLNSLSFSLIDWVSEWVSDYCMWSNISMVSWILNPSFPRHKFMAAFVCAQKTALSTNPHGWLAVWNERFVCLQATTTVTATSEVKDHDDVLNCGSNPLLYRLWTRCLIVRAHPESTSSVSRSFQTSSLFISWNTFYRNCLTDW